MSLAHKATVKKYLTAPQLIEFMNRGGMVAATGDVAGVVPKHKNYISLPKNANINRYIVPNDIITLLTTIYKHIGKNETYEETTKNSMTKIIEQTVQRDAFFLGKIHLQNTKIRNYRRTALPFRSQNPCGLH